MARATSSARRGFGRIERRESGRYRAGYTGPDGQLYRAPVTFDAKDDAVASGSGSTERFVSGPR